MDNRSNQIFIRHKYRRGTASHVMEAKEDDDDAYYTPHTYRTNAMNLPYVKLTREREPESETLKINASVCVCVLV